MLAHFVTVQYLACAQSDVLFAAQGSLAALGGRGDLLQLLLGRSQQFGPLARALFGQQRIEANDQAFAREVRMSDLDQIGLIEDRHRNCPPAASFWIWVARRAEIHWMPWEAGKSSRMRALVIMPRSPISTISERSNRWRGLSTWVARAL